VARLRDCTQQQSAGFRFVTSRTVQRPAILQSLRTRRERLSSHAAEPGRSISEQRRPSQGGFRSYALLATSRLRWCVSADAVNDAATNDS